MRRKNKDASLVKKTGNWLELIWGFWILFRVIILVFRTISQQLNSKTEFGPGLEQFKQIRTNLRFLDPI
jgi:hypothetical protein